MLAGRAATIFDDAQSVQELERDRAQNHAMYGLMIGTGAAGVATGVSGALVVAF